MKVNQHDAVLVLVGCIVNRSIVLKKLETEVSLGEVCYTENFVKTFELACVQSGLVHILDSLDKEASMVNCAVSTSPDVNERRT